jgi:hypothetical protein
MARLLFILCLGGVLGAQAPLHIVAVERKGPPPYEAADRIYRLDGGADRGLRPGQRLAIRRSGEPRLIGHLRLTEVRGEVAEGQFLAAGSAYPMKGDLVWREELAAMPELVPGGSEPLPPLAAPATPAPPPPREGLLLFLPHRAELSPAGQLKVQGWVEAWGRGGKWVVQVPASRALSPALQKQRAQALVAALKAQGVVEVELEATPRTAEGKYDPAWVRHSE